MKKPDSAGRVARDGGIARKHDEQATLLRRPHRNATVAAVDLFCGVGGLSAGMIAAGFDVVEAYDNWAAATTIYERNLGGHTVNIDLMDAEDAAERIADIEPMLIAGAPPCQDFSTAGKRSEGNRANLTTAFGEIITSVQPPAFLMENVPQVRLSDTYRLTRHAIKRCGYQMVEAVLDASLLGVPQKRRRFFAFGWLGTPEIGDRFTKALNAAHTDEPLTVRAYLGDEIDIEHYYRHPRNYTRRSVWSVDEPSPTVRGVNRPVPPNYAGNHLDSVPPSTVRPLTTRERGRVQTFPADWKWKGGDRNADTELQIGNAVPVEMAARVANSVRYALSA